MTVHAPRRLFTVEEFHRMADGGVFAEDDRLELIAGDIVEMTPIGSRHAACVDRLARELQRSIPATTIVRVQSPIVLGRDSEPQPDIAVLRYRTDFYRDRHPGPGDVLLVIEVADTSIAFDRGTKLPLYARAGIPELWIVDLAASAVEIWRQPVREACCETERISGSGRLTSSSLPGFDVAVAEVIG
ncbi:MAG TPA: Uma2 family endonuclease [Vicinamibacterales bacterium]|nr:Uma2 family endonuclease [Vicinamibacterales bacterium]